jgi:hypothetical protein
MSVDGPVIDLGELRPEEPAEQRRPPLALTRGVRNGALAGLAALTAVLLGGSATPGPAPVRRVAVIDVAPVRAYALGDGDAFVLRQQADGGAGDAVTAYALADGSRRWSVPAGPGMYDVQWWGEFGLLIGVTADQRTVAWDAGTGAVRWRAAGTFAGVAAGTVLLTDTYGPAGRRRLTVADPRTGAPVWSVQAAGFGSLGVDEADGTAAAARVVDVADDGAVVVRRLADGAEAGRGRVERRTGPGREGAEFRVDVGDGLLTTVETDGRGTTVAAYATDGLALSWRRHITGRRDVNRCGPVVCISDGVTVTGHELRTGRQVWATREWRWTGAVEQGYLVTHVGDPENPQVRLVDPATGRTVAAYGGGILAWGSRGLLLRPEQAGPGGRRELGGRAVVTRVGGDGRPARVLGTISGVTWPDCRGVGPYLVCPTVLDALVVWQVDG